MQAHAETDRLASELVAAMNYVDETYVREVQRAIVAARGAHAGQTRASGSPFITHPISVGLLLAQLKVDYKCVVAAILHDVLEDTLYTVKKLAAEFGEDVAAVVDGLTKLEQIPSTDRDVLQAESFRKMLMAMSKDVRVLVVKLADRLHNMQTLCFLPEQKQKRIASETLYIYAPMARRLGMSSINLELENLSFMYLYPLRFHAIDKALRRVEQHNVDFLNEVMSLICDSLKGANLQYVGVSARRKHTYSVYKKMRFKGRAFSEINDVFGVRVCMQNLTDCYSALGVLHQLFKPMISKFKDYIALPKANGYQSLHTVLFGPKGTKIEVQIRSEEMDELANTGVAAHFLYKSPLSKRKQAPLGAHDWFSRLMHMQKGVGNALEFMEHVKIDLYPGEVYVFTPSGEIMELPKGATVIDFAYAVHTSVGNNCVLAKINQQITPLSTVLSNGQTVQVLTENDAKPHESWLSFVVTGRAKTAIRDYFKQQRKAELIALGRQLLVKSANGIEHVLHDMNDIALDDVASGFEKKHFPQILEAVALGNIPVHEVLFALQKECSDMQLLQAGGQRPLVVTGKDHLVINYANCCHPIPGDALVGFLSAGEGIYVHRKQCGYARELIIRDRYELLQVEWSSETQNYFQCKLELDLVNQRGALASVALLLSRLGSNIEEVKTDVVENGVTRIMLLMGVSSRIHLNTVVKHLRRESFVIRIRRHISADKQDSAS